MISLRLIKKVVRQTHLLPMTLIYLVLFFLAATLITLTYPGKEFGDSVWLCFETATSIGFGDVSTAGLACRVILVCLSILSIFYFAIVTGVAASICISAAKAQNKKSLTAVIDQLEHLDEKSPEELKEISERVKMRRSKWLA